MISDELKKQKEPTQEVIKVILELFNLNDLTKARKEIHSQIIKYPNSSILFNILGAILSKQNQLEKAVENYKKAIKINPNYHQAYNNLGIALHKLKKINDAIDNYKKALSYKSDFPEALNNLGNAMKELNKLQESLQYFEKAIKIKSDYAEAYNSLGGAYQDLGNKGKALNNFKEAIRIKPDYVEAHNNLGILFADLARYDDAIISYNKAIKLEPKYEKSYNNLGNLYNALGKYENANKAYRQAVEIKPGYLKAHSNLLFNLNYKTNFDPNLYLEEAKKFGVKCKLNKKKLSYQYQYEKKPTKLKVGFVTSDFGNHPGGYFTLSTLRELKNKNFELIAYSNFDRKDEFSHHFEPLFLKWNSIENKNDEEVVEQIYKDGIHILIEMQGHSAKNRIPVFIYKPAPIQITWLAQGTLGVPEIDYFIGSHHITPRKEESYFVEKILRLPEISQCFTPPDFDLNINSLPAVNNNFVTFGCLNKLSKVSDIVIALWSKILLSVSNSKLLLKSKEFDNEKVVNDTFKRFKKNNIDENRLILKGKSKTRKEVLEVFHQVDIALDPFPFQGNTSTCESVWMGVPVITLRGDRYMSHFGESINFNLGMSDWVAENHEEYLNKAVKFCSDLKKLSIIRKNLRKTALESPVFDAQRFAGHFGKLLWEVWKKFNN